MKERRKAGRDMRKHRLKAVPIIFYILSALMLVYMISLVVNCHTYIQSLADNGQLVVEDSRFEILSYYMANCSQYGFFALMLAAMGNLIGRSHRQENALPLPAAAPVIDADLIDDESNILDDDALADWKVADTDIR